jgi:hypothetical protein
LLEAARAEAEHHWATGLIRSTQRGALELRSVKVERPKPFWAVVTRGLSHRAGVELGVRVEASASEAMPPDWAFELVEHLAARASEVTLSAGHVLRWEGVFRQQTDLDAVALIDDPWFGAIETPHDRVPVLLAIGITRDEARLVREWSPQALAEILRHVDPTLCTSLDRPSLLSSPRSRSAIEQRVEREGSSMGVLTARVSSTSGKSSICWKLDVDTADALVSLLKGRIGHQRSFVVKSASEEVEVAPGQAPTFGVEGDRTTLTLTQPFARSMRATLRSTPGRYVFADLPSLAIEVVA